MITKPRLRSATAICVFEAATPKGVTNEASIVVMLSQTAYA